MGSGFNFFTDGIDKTPATTGNYVDVDCSGDIPSGSTGVILKIVNTDSSVRGARVRENGSTFIRTQKVDANGLVNAFVGVDSDLIFEAYIETTLVKIYLIGYTDENVDFFLFPIEKSPTATGWQDVDASADIPEGSTGVICSIDNSHASTVYYGGIRKNGSSDEYPYGGITPSYCVYYQLCGVDVNRVFEAKLSNTSYVNIFLWGYTKSPITFFDNGISKALTGINAWTDIDVTADTEATADGAILFIKNTSTTKYKGDIRKNGSTDNHTANSSLFNTGCRGAAIGMDSEQIFEGWINNVQVDFYLIGYCKPAVGVIDKSFSDAGLGSEAFINPYRAMGFSEVGAGSEIFGIPFKALPFSDAGQGADAFNTPFKAMGFSDVGSGLDSFIVLLSKAFADAGLGSDVFAKELTGFLEKAFADVGLGTDAFLIPFKSMKFSDSALGSDVFTIPFKALIFVDAGTGTDVFVIPFKTMSFSDLGSGTDVFFLLRELAFSDSGLGSDVFVIPFKAMRFLDLGLGSDTFNILFKAMGFSDIGNGVDIFALLRELAFSDVGLASDVFQILFKAMQFSDLGSGADSFSKEILGFILKAFSDAGLGSDIFNIPFRAMMFQDSGLGTDVWKGANLIEAPLVIVTADGKIILRISRATKKEPDYIMLG